MFGRKRRRLSIILDSLCPDSEQARPILAEALEIVELSPALRASPVCWALSARVYSSLGEELTSRLRKRTENSGDILATSGYSGFPHAALQKAELAREVAWAFRAPLQPPGSSHPRPRLYFPREPDDRFAELDLVDGSGVPYLEGVIADPSSKSTYLRFYSESSRCDVDAALVSAACAPDSAHRAGRRPSKRSRLRRYRDIVPDGSAGGIVVFELLCLEDLEPFRFFADVAGEETSGPTEILPVGDFLSPRTVSGGTQVHIGRRTVGDGRALFAAAEARAAGRLPEALFAVFEDAYRSAPPSPEKAGDGIPRRRDLGANMAGHAILDESELHAFFEDGRIGRILFGDQTLTEGPPARSWVDIGDAPIELELMDAISFQNDTSRGLRSDFVTPAGSPIVARLLVDAMVLDGCAAVFFEAHLAVTHTEPEATVRELVPICIPVGPSQGMEISITCAYPDGEELVHRLPAANGTLPGRRDSMFGSRFVIRSGSCVAAVTHLHPSRRYVGEAMVVTEHRNGEDRVSLALGPLCRGVPAATLCGVSQRFCFAVGPVEARLPLSSWPVDLGLPGVWLNRGNGEVEG